MNGLLGVIIPETSATTNLCTNPSFETNTTGWTTGGTNTIALSSVKSRRGVYSLKCTYTDNDLLASYAITLTDTDHTAAMDIYIPSTYTGTQLTLTWTDYTGATITAGTVDMTKTDQWQRVHCHINPDSGDLVGTLTLSETGTNGSAAEFIYIDGVLIVALDHEVVFIDGDQDDCYWTGTAHGSTSVRYANSREGGELIDLEDYGFYLESFIGSGMANTVSLTQDMGLLPGAIDAGEKITTRNMTIVGDLLGSSQNNLHVNKQSIIDAFKSDRVKNNQQAWLVYEGGNTTRPVRIKVKYNGGLSTNEQVGFSEKLGIRLQATDPFWYEDGEEGFVLDTNTSIANADYILKRNSDGVWSAMAGINATVYAIAQHPITKEIYIAGNFINASGDVNADHLAKWNGTTWEYVVTGISGNIWDIVFASNGDLYIAGTFTNLGDANGDLVVKWDGTSLSSLGTGMQGGTVCLALAIDSSDNLYAGGDFTTAGGVANTAKIAKWDGSVWTPLSTGLNNTVWDITIDRDDNVYIVGQFTDAGDANGDYITKWTGSAFESLGTGANSVLYSVMVDDSNNVYVGGNVTTLGGVTVAYWGKWNGKKWEALGDGTSAVVRRILRKDNKIYLSGDFTTAGDISLTDRTAIWNGSTYAHLDIDLPGTPAVYSIFFDHEDNLYIGFNTSGTAYSGTVNTVTNSGTTRAYPKVVFKRSGGTSATVAYLKNETTGATIWLNYPLQDGEELTLDFRLGNRSVVSSTRGNVQGTALLRASDFTDFYLLPGENKINAYIIEAGSPTVTAKMNWKITHWSADGSA